VWKRIVIANIFLFFANAGRPPNTTSLGITHRRKGIGRVMRNNFGESPSIKHVQSPQIELNIWSMNWKDFLLLLICKQSLRILLIDWETYHAHSHTHWLHVSSHSNKEETQKKTTLLVCGSSLSNYRKEEANKFLIYILTPCILYNSTTPSICNAWITC